VAETPAVPATDPEPPAEATEPLEEEQITPAAPQTGGWQPPEPEPAPAPPEPASSDPTPPTEEQPLPDKDDEDDDGDDWRTWSGKAINP
jgi:hypothetical protein